MSTSFGNYILTDIPYVNILKTELNKIYIETKVVQKEFFINETIEQNEDSGIKIKLFERDKEQLCKSAQDLTLQEAENGFVRAMVAKGQRTVKELDIILDRKSQVIKKTGILEFINTSLNIDDVSYFENMKKWLSKRNNSWLGTV